LAGKGSRRGLGLPRVPLQRLVRPKEVPTVILGGRRGWWPPKLGLLSTATKLPAVKTRGCY
jgi:hypothetical protein